MRYVLTHWARISRDPGRRGRPLKLINRSLSADLSWFLPKAVELKKEPLHSFLRYPTLYHKLTGLSTPLLNFLAYFTPI